MKQSVARFMMKAEVGLVAYMFRCLFGARVNVFVIS